MRLHVAPAEGAAFAYLGGDVLTVTPGVATLRDPLRRPEARFGSAVSAVGDVDGDGYDDLAVGAPGPTESRLDAGRVLVFHGAPDDPWRRAPLVLENPEAQVGSGFGSTLAFVGDIDGDGFGDLAVGAPRFSDSATEEGIVFVYCGTPRGLSAEPCATLRSPGRRESALFGDSIASGP